MKTCDAHSHLHKPSAVIAVSAAARQSKDGRDHVAGLLDRYAAKAARDEDALEKRSGVSTQLPLHELPGLHDGGTGAIETIGPRVEEAARSLGAAPGRSFWRVVWPLALPGTATAGILCFILAMNAYATPYLLGGPRFQTMAPLLYWEFGANNNWPFASALALVLMTTTLLLTSCSGLLIPRRYRV